MIVALARSCHPGPTVVVTTVAVVLAIAVDQPAGAVALIAVTVLCGQLSIGWSNDWLDARRDIVVGRPDKPVALGEISVVVVQNAALTSVVLSVPLSLANGLLAGLAHLGLVASGWAYNLGLKSSVWSWLPYAVGFGLLPAFVTLTLAGSPWPPWWVVASGSMLGVGAHLANALPDLDDDLSLGVSGLPQLMGRRRAGLLAVVLLLAVSILLLVAPAGAPTVGGWLGLGLVLVMSIVALGAVRGGGMRPRLFPAVMVIAVVDTVLLAGSTAAGSIGG